MRTVLLPDGLCESFGVPPPLLHSPPLELQPAGPRDLDFFADLNSNADVMDRGLGYWVGYVEAQPIG